VSLPVRGQQRTLGKEFWENLRGRGWCSPFLNQWQMLALGLAHSPGILCSVALGSAHKLQGLEEQIFKQV